MTDATRRRSLLGAVFGVGIAIVAGCFDGTDADDDAGTRDDSTPGTSADPTATDAEFGGGEGGNEEQAEQPIQNLITD